MCLVEKPIAVEVAEADKMIAAADAARRLLAVNFQERFRPAVDAAHQFMVTGELGDLVRVLCVEPWFRTAAYYHSATWRGTWRGEGGGVLMNQAPHTLDRLCYLVGSPASVWGWTRKLRHMIETEDTAQAMLVYPNGAPGYVEVSTVEAGSPPELQIVGNRMALEFRGESLTIRRFQPSLSKFSATSPGAALPRQRSKWSRSSRQKQSRQAAKAILPSIVICARPFLLDASRVAMDAPRWPRWSLPTP